MKRTIFLLLSIILGIYLIYAVFSLINNIGNYTSFVEYLIVFIVLLGLIFLELFFVKRYKKYSDPELLKQEKRNKELKLKEEWDKEKIIPGSKARINDLGADICINARHMTGLPINEGADTFLYRCEDKVIFERNETTYELELTKIKDITIKTDVEIQKSYVSSVGGAVGGYVLFGPLGAMIGGRAKEKKSQNIEKYLIFSYENNNNNIEYISFEVTNIPNATLFENLMDNKKRIRSTVKL